MPTAATDSPIHLSGELTFAVTRKLYEQLNTQLRTQLQSSKTLRIDLSEVREVDSAGLALLVHCANLAAQHQAVCIFTNPSTQLRQMASIADLDELFHEQPQ